MPQKNRLFWYFLRCSCICWQMINNFGSIFGPPWPHFWLIFAHQILVSFFERFLRKNAKTRKVKTWLRTSKLLCFVKVAWFKKKHTTIKKTCFLVIFWSQIKQKPIEKSEKAQCATKVNENVVPENTFWAKGWFFPNQRTLDGVLTFITKGI